MCQLADVRVHVAGIDHPDVRISLAKRAYGRIDLSQSLALIFPPVRGQQEDAVPVGPSQRLMVIRLAFGELQRVDGRVSGHDDLLFPDVLLQKVVPAGRCRGKVKVSHAGDELTVHLLRIRGILMISTQPCLDMPDGDLLIERGERGCEGRRGIAVDQDHVGLLILQHRCQPLQDVAGDAVQGLAVLHDVQIMIGLDLECLQHAVQHLSVLGADADDALQLGMLFDRVDDRCHLDGLRPGAENTHDFIHEDPPFGRFIL